MGKWDNPEYVREYKRNWAKKEHELNPEKVRARQNKWRKANHEKVLQTAKNWRDRNPEKTQQYTASQFLRDGYEKRQERYKKSNFSIGHIDKDINYFSTSVSLGEFSKPCQLNLHSICKGRAKACRKCQCDCHKFTLGGKSK